MYPNHILATTAIGLILIAISLIGVLPLIGLSVGFLMLFVAGCQASDHETVHGSKPPNA